MDIACGGFGDLTRDQRRYGLVQLDEMLRNGTAFGRRSLQDLRLVPALENATQLPCQVDRMMNASIHTLRGSRRVSVGCITSQDNAVLTLGGIGDSLADGVQSPPVDGNKLDLGKRHGLGGFLLDDLFRDTFAVLILGSFRQSEADSGTSMV